MVRCRQRTMCGGINSELAACCWSMTRHMKACGSLMGTTLHLARLQPLVRGCSKGRGVLSPLRVVSPLLLDMTRWVASHQ